MKTRSAYWIGFGLMVLLQILVPFRMMVQSEGVLKTGKAFKFRTAPVDPNDPFRGKFVTLGFEANTYVSNSADQYEPGLKVYVTLAEDQEGYAAIRDIGYDKPTGTADYTQATISSSVRQADNKQKVIVEYPFDRFYVNEKIATDVENRYREIVRDSDQIAYALVSVKSGRAVIQDLVLGGTSVTEMEH